MKAELAKYYEVFQLPASAIEFIYKERLSILGLSLAHELVSNKHSFHLAKTFLPIRSEKENLLNYKETILGKIPKDIHKDIIQKRFESKIQFPVEELWFYPIILEYLQSDPNNICIIELLYEKLDVLYSIRRLEDDGIFYAFYKNEVYAVLNRFSSLEQISSASGLASSEHEIYIFTKTYSNKFFGQEKVKLNKQDLKELADNIQKIAVAAYDGESFILCE